MKRHDRAFLQSVDLNTEANLGSQLDEDYDAGWPSSSTGLWSAKGPTVYAPRMGLVRSAKLHAQWALGGWSDANQWKRAMKLVRMYVRHSPRSAELRLGLVKGLLLSGVVCALVYFFSLTLLPEFRGADEEEAHAVWVGSVSSAFWLYPLIAGSYLVASTWTMGVAEAALSAQNLHVPDMRERLQHTSWVEHVSRAVLIANYSLVCLALQYLPWIGPILAFLVMSLVDGYFCFEQVWVVRGWTLEKVRCLAAHTAPAVQRVTLVVPGRLRRTIHGGVLLPPKRAAQSDAVHARVSCVYGAGAARRADAHQLLAGVAGDDAADRAASRPLQGTVGTPARTHPPVLADGARAPLAADIRTARRAAGRREPRGAEKVRPARYGAAHATAVGGAVCRRRVDRVTSRLPRAVNAADAGAECLGRLHSAVARVVGQHPHGLRPGVAGGAQVSQDAVGIRHESTGCSMTRTTVRRGVAGRATRDPPIRQCCPPAAATAGACHSTPRRRSG